MISDLRTRGRFRATVVWLLLYMAAGWVTAHFYLHYADTVGPAFEWFPQTEIGSMVDQTGQKPFVGRMLVPLVVKQMDDLSTPDIQQAERWFWANTQDFDPDFIYGGAVRPKHSVEATNLYFLSILLFMLIPLAGRAAYGAVYHDRGFKAGLAGLLLLITVPLWFSVTSFFYDPMTLLLSTLLVYCAARGKPFWSIVIFILAALNKETSVFFIPVLVYGMYSRYTASKLKDDLYYTYLVAFATVVIAVLVQIYRTNHFAANPGDWLEHHWSDTAPILFSKLLLETLHAALIAVVMLSFPFIGFRSKPRILKVALLFVFTPLAVASVVFGRIIEIRAYYDAYPILGLLAMPTLYKLVELTQGDDAGEAGANGPEETIGGLVSLPQERLASDPLDSKHEPL